MRRTDDLRTLNTGWRVERFDGVGGTIPANVPGVVQYDLMAAGQLANPYAGTVEATAAHWVSATAWRYVHDFELSHEDLASQWSLDFDGIDTFGEIFVNGTSIAVTANALRRVRAVIPQGVAKAGTNRLEVVISSHESGVAHLIEEARTRLRHEGAIEGLLGKSLLRRYQRSFFSMSSLLNLGTGVLGIGINGPVSLRRLRPVTIGALFVETVELVGSAARVRCTLEVDAEDGAQVTISMTAPDTERTVILTTQLEGGESQIVLETLIHEPALWWPVGYGKANLYHAVVDVTTPGGDYATHEQTFGIRTVDLVQENATGRPTFQFVVNGEPIWVRGTNYIPVDYLKVLGTEEQYARVFALLESGNNNMVRMWGGGASESDEWYNECDRRGILIWQDFYLHSNTYPDYDEAWVNEFRLEAEELIRNVRSHPSVALLCGGNEQREGWEEWHWRETLSAFHGESLVVDVIPDILSRVPSGVPYINNSPHGGTFSQSPVKGDAHVWGNHFNSTKDPLFVAETCWGQESYSRPETLAELMDLDVDEFVGPDWKQRWTSRTSLPVLIRFPYSGYHSIGGLRAYLKDLEIEQAMADYFSLSNFRLRAPSCRGILYWSFNKGGPLFQFGAIDYGLRPMMSHFVVGRLNREVVVGAYRDVSDVRVVVSNARAAKVTAHVEALHLDGHGNVIGRWDENVEVEPGAPQNVMALTGLYDRVIDRTTESVHVRLTSGEQLLSDDHLLFCPLVEFLPENTALDAELKQVDEESWSLTVWTAGVSKMVQIEGADDLILDQNYFPLVAGRPVTVKVEVPTHAARPSQLTLTTLDGDGTVVRFEQ